MRRVRFRAWAAAAAAAMLLIPAAHAQGAAGAQAPPTDRPPIVVDADDGPLALAVAAAVAQPGDVILVGPGTFDAPGPLPPGVTVRGAGADRTTLRARRFVGLAGAPRGSLVVEDLTLRAEGPRAVVGVASAGRLAVRRCAIEGFEHGVALAGAEHALIERSVLRGCALGVRTSAGAGGAGAVTLEAVRFERCRVGLLHLAGAAELTEGAFAECGVGLVVVAGGGAGLMADGPAFDRCRRAGAEVIGGERAGARASGIRAEPAVLLRGPRFVGPAERIIADRAGLVRIEPTADGPGG